MGRRKNDNNPVSLFAFQDIITSITGIMVLVVLLIILDIIDHKDTVSSKTPSPYKEDIEKLENTRKELQEKLDKDKEWLTKNQEMIVKALSIDLASLPKMIKKERKKNLLMQAALRTTEQENVRLESMVLQTKEEIKKDKEQLKVNDDAIADMKKKLETGDLKLKELLKKIEELKEDEKKRKNRVEIRTTSELRQSPVFIEISESEIRTKVIKTSRIEEFKNDKKDLKNLLIKFYTWLKKTRDPEKECIVIIVKPSSAKFALDLVGILKQEGFSYNMEPMEEDKTGIYE